MKQEGSIVWAILSRPEKANALDQQSVEQLLDTLTRAEADPLVRVLIIKGMGRNFCAGADLSELLAGGSDGIRRLLERFRELLSRLERSRLIIIAAAHGAVRAGGLELALACDVVLAARSCTFGDAHVANGLLPGGGSTARLPRAVGWQRAKWLILSGASIDAGVARDWGLVFDVADDSDLEAAAVRIADSMTGSEAHVIGKAKRLLAMVSEQPLSASLDAEITTLEAHYHSAGFQRGVTSFLQRKTQ